MNEYRMVSDAGFKNPLLQAELLCSMKTAGHPQEAGDQKPEPMAIASDVKPESLYAVLLFISHRVIAKVQIHFCARSYKPKAV